MNFISVIKKRRSVRLFQKKKPDQETIKKIIEIGTYAPSACNIQGWRFIIVEKKHKKQQIVDQGGSINIKKAPLGILVLYDNRTKNTEYMDNVQSASAAIQNMLLTIEYLGLGACWTCHLPNKKHLRKIFNIPNTFSPIAYLIIGYKKNKPVKIKRKYKINEIISFDTFSSDIKIEEINQFKLELKKLLTKLYRLMPLSIKKRWLNQYLDKNFVKKFKN